LDVLVRKRTDVHRVLLSLSGDVWHVVRGVGARIPAASVVLVLVMSTVTVAPCFGHVNQN
jgi:hypothetical protein